MSDDFERPDDCGCEEEIQHFLHNLDFFAKTCDNLKHIALSKSEVLNLFKAWFELTSFEEEEEESPFGFFGRMMDAFGDSVNLTDVEPNLSFNIDLDANEEDDDDDSVSRT